ncbi:putative NBD/HSP70 family sugar kinase [Devosia sp. UYZn731]|uniref:ROK family transcriptional regulator n=1 Tax=Devosia sp. UYZn731 TaxID=3156345 RepID=UPI00339208E9
MAAGNDRAPMQAKGKGATSIWVREANERRVLSALRRHGPATRAEIAAYAGITFNTTWRILDSLQSRGLVRDGGRRKKQRGMPPSVMELDPEGAYSYGVMVDRDRIEVLLADLTSQIVEKRHHSVDYPLPTESLLIVKQLLAEIDARITDVQRTKIVGLGLSIPNQLGGWAAELSVPAEAVPAWNGFDFPAALARATGLEITVENDGTAAAVGEMFNGLGRTLSSFVYLFIGPSAGGGVVLNDDYWRGSTGTAGDFGLTPVPPSKLAAVGLGKSRYQILAGTASLSALVRHLRHNGIDASYGKLPGLLAPHANLVEEWIDDALAGLVPTMLAAVCLLDPEGIVVAGSAPPELLARLRSRLAAELNAAAPEGRAIPPILEGQVGEDAPVFGAAVLPLHLTFASAKATN